MSNFVRFFDSVEFTPIDPEKAKDYYTPVAGEAQPLFIRVAATHAGKVTRNNGFYLPHKMRAGATTFTAQYPKPIQVHHDEHSDPIGRVVSATYIDLVQPVKDAWRNKKDSLLNLDWLDVFVAGTIPHKDLIDMAINRVIKDMELIKDPDYEGLGYIELVAKITDPDAIQKFRDGRYLTGSTGASTNQAVCSVCKEDWAKEGKCEHTPGQMYDGVLCVLIAGDLVYDEWSVVNRPADRHSRVIEVNVNGIQDFVKLDPEQTLDAQGIALVDHAEEDQPMDEKNEVVKSPLEILLGDAYKDVLGEDEEGKTYLDMFTALLESTPEIEREAIQKEVKDAVLTAAARKKLPSSVFCKPPKGYPVHDCAHAKAAMAYAKKNNEASSVVSCIRRKASRLGCPFKDEVIPTPVLDEFGQFTIGYFDLFSNDEVIQLRNGIQATLKERGLDCGCKEDELKNKIDELEKTLANPTQPSTELDSAKKELGLLHDELTTLQAALGKATEELRDSQVSHIATLQSVSGEVVEFTTLKDSFAQKTSDEVNGILKELQAKVDTKKIADNLSSGLSNNPTVPVEDPTLVVDNSKPENRGTASDKVKVDERIAERVRLNWLTIRSEHGENAAEKYIKDCKAAGLLPTNWPDKE